MDNNRDDNPRKESKIMRESRFSKSFLGLEEGNKSNEVSILQTYLKRFGYLDFEYSQPGYDPSIHGDPCRFETGLFDFKTRIALEKLQQRSGLQITGDVSTETLGLLQTPRCGVSDQDGYVIDGRRWEKLDLSYSFRNFSPDLSQGETKGAIRLAFDIWSQETLLRFREVTMAESPDIVIQFASGDHGDGKPFDGVGGVLAHAFYPPLNEGELAGDAHFDEAETWTINLTSGTDLVTIAAHEFGHSLGLGHSDARDALMYHSPLINGPHRFLAPDDMDGITSLYPSSTGRTWEQLPKRGWDLGIGGPSDDVWMMSGSEDSRFDMGIWKFDKRLIRWSKVEGYGRTIDVDPNGIPYVTNNAGEIWRQINGRFEAFPGPAYDLAIGSNGSMWKLGTDRSYGGWSIYRWNGTHWEKYEGGGKRIAVSPGGLPWVVNNKNEIWHFNGNQFVAAPGSGIDISFGADGSLWKVDTDGQVSRWRSASGSWRSVKAWAASIAVARNGLPWVTNPDGGIFRRV
jgi:hypothetical protein